jgi:hypothetical protein
MVVERFGWTLTQIDETDMERMLEFVLYFMYWKKKTTPKRASGNQPLENGAYADQIDWSKL